MLRSHTYETNLLFAIASELSHKCPVEAVLFLMINKSIFGRSYTTETNFWYNETPPALVDSYHILFMVINEKDLRLKVDSYVNENEGD